MRSKKTSNLEVLNDSAYAIYSALLAGEFAKPSPALHRPHSRRIRSICPGVLPPVKGLIRMIALSPYRPQFLL